MTQEADRRRSIAVISHPDAGKSTLTEALALHAHAIDHAGAVHGKAGRSGTVSDWSEIERARGISITSAALQFEYGDHMINLLDTPGHADFSEDTYRVLTAVDAAIMLLDASKGLEPQTLKLFDVCRRRGVPVITFVNKWDRPGKGVLELCDELEQRIGLRPTPLSWPIGEAGRFVGLLDRADAGARTYRKAPGGANLAEETHLDADAAATRTGRGLRHRLRRGPPARARRPRVLPGGQDHADAVRGRPGEHRRPPIAGHRHRPRAVAARPAHRPRGLARGRHPVQRIRVQDSGGHGPQPPRSPGVRAGVLRPVRARHGGHPRAHQPPLRHQVRAVRLWPRARHHRGGLPRRRGRPGQREQPHGGGHPVRSRGRARAFPADARVRARALCGGVGARPGPIQAVPQGHRATRARGRGAGADLRGARRRQPHPGGRGAAAV